jgi:nicotinate-nucleotide adenylyltransferase
MKIGICGGTFDPFHRGHLDPILAVRQALAWDRVVFVPAWITPFKMGETSASAFHRFAMAVLATEGRPGLYVDARELQRGAVSYSSDTLEGFRRQHPTATLDWIIGDDNLSRLLEWKAIDVIFGLANFAVLTREGEGAASLPSVLAPKVTDAASRSAFGSIVFAHNSVVPVSSTEVRRRVREGKPIDGLVDERVSRYIQHNELYRRGDS